MIPGRGVEPQLMNILQKLLEGHTLNVPAMVRALELRSEYIGSRNTKPNCGAPAGIRTPNLLIRSQMLYPLSYGRLSLITGYKEYTKRRVYEQKTSVSIFNHTTIICCGTT